MWWWTIAEIIMVAAAVALCAGLIWWPKVGLHAFWDVLIPAAPALVVLAPGLWRNICPLGTTSQLGRRMGGVRGAQLTTQWQARMGLIGVVLLLVLVPLRHPWFNLGGTATLILLVGAGIAALILGVLFAGKSGWCTGACPVHAVERLYGSQPLLTVTSAHCSSCVRCTVPCPDTSPGTRHGLGQPTLARTTTLAIIVGGFPGFVWGWFQVPDGISIAATETWVWPLGCMLITMVLWLLLRSVLPQTDGRRLDALFAASAVSCYYWFRLPALFGYGVYPGDGMLVDLRGTAPSIIFDVARVALAIFFVWWMVIRVPAPRPWMYKPPQEKPESAPVTMTVGLTA
jgi:hypothetical protein